MLSERSVARRLKRGNSPHLLTGLIFDDRGNPMSPTHTNKKGVRYRYYTSHALLQRRKSGAPEGIRTLTSAFGGHRSCRAELWVRTCRTYAVPTPDSLPDEAFFWAI